MLPEDGAWVKVTHRRKSSPKAAAAAAADKRNAVRAACPQRKPRWVEREEAARQRKPTSSIDRDLDAYFFDKETNQVAGK